MKKNKKFVLISDFDGTISKVDFFMYVVNNLLKPSDLRPWQDFLDKKITHIDALIGIFGNIKTSRSYFDKFILDLPLEEAFIETVGFCKSNDIDIYILSAGADYYIKLILQNLNIENDVKLITNKSYFIENDGLIVIRPDQNDPYYSYEYGVDKVAVVEELKLKYDYCVFAGDGHFDFPSARLSDTIFARKKLLKLCLQHNIDCIELINYKQILDHLKDL
ncbi:MAG: MtnX-like HAD-IB family phosphatase [Cyanobacteriota bacterium]